MYCIYINSYPYILYIHTFDVCTERYKMGEYGSGVWVYVACVCDRMYVGVYVRAFSVSHTFPNIYIYCSGGVALFSLCVCVFFLSSFLLPLNSVRFAEDGPICIDFLIFLGNRQSFIS